LILHSCRRFALIVKSYVPASFTPAISWVVGSSTLRNSAALPARLLRERLSFSSSRCRGLPICSQHLMKKTAADAPRSIPPVHHTLRHGRLAQRLKPRHFLDLGLSAPSLGNRSRGGLNVLLATSPSVLGRVCASMIRRVEVLGDTIAASFARNHPRIRALHLNHDRREYTSGYSERAESLVTSLPRRASNAQPAPLPRCASAASLRIRRLSSSARTAVFVRTFSSERHGALVLAIVSSQEHPRDRVRVVPSGRLPEFHSAGRLCPWGVVQLRYAHAHIHIRKRLLATVWSQIAVGPTRTTKSWRTPYKLSSKAAVQLCQAPRRSL